MLTIENIGKLKGEELNDWRILDAGEDIRSQIGKNVYLLTFAKLDRDGNILDDRAGVIIDRNKKSPKGYYIKIVYESWGYEIDTIVWNKENIMDKNAFFGRILYKINTEYYKRK